MRFLVIFLSLVVLPATCPGVPIPPALKRPVRKGGPIRIVVVDVDKQQGPIVERLRSLQFEVVLRSWKGFDPLLEKDCDLVLLPTMFAHREEVFAGLEGKSQAFHRFVRQGGGLLVCQPNPPKSCTPGLLPYPITFHNSYDSKNPARVNLDPQHYITRGLAGNAMPFPADPMVQIDPRYVRLARQVSTGWHSLAVTTFGRGRVVVQTANENRGATIPLGDEILRRMVLWAARHDLPP